MKNKLPYFLTALILGAFIVGLFWFMSEPKEENQIKGIDNYVVAYTFFNATTTTATSTNINDSAGQGYANIEGAKKVTFAFARGDTTGQGNTGTSAFSIEVTHDGANWFSYKNLLSATSTEIAPFASYSIAAATTTVFLSMDLTNDIFNGVRVIVNETTDGEHSASAKIEF